MLAHVQQLVPVFVFDRKIVTDRANSDKVLAHLIYAITEEPVWTFSQQGMLRYLGLIDATARQNIREHLAKFIVLHVQLVVLYVRTGHDV